MRGSQKTLANLNATAEFPARTNLWQFQDSPSGSLAEATPWPAAPERGTKGPEDGSCLGRTTGKPRAARAPKDPRNLSLTRPPLGCLFSRGC
jgi:hypothetical protein